MKISFTELFNSELQQQVCFLLFDVKRLSARQLITIFVSVCICWPKWCDQW